MFSFYNKKCESLKQFNIIPYKTIKEFIENRDIFF